MFSYAYGSVPTLYTQFSHIQQVGRSFGPG